MYTVLWSENYIDKWERVETKKEVKKLLQKIENTPDACSLEDVWIFTPEADEFALSGDEFE